MITEKMIERVASAIDAAQCPGREGPYGLYDYSDYPGNAAPHRVRDFRDLKSDTYGNHVFKSTNRDEAKAEYERLTKEHVAKAAIEAAISTGALPSLKVKALEWEDEDEGQGLECWRARPPLGPIYTLEDDGFSSLKYHVTANQLVLGTFKDLATAKAAAQADYEARIRAALSAQVPCE